ncbi:RluA family pseudouridine synthase [Lottiidibacillus patelloidae]|uniref:Pseudouridine synthase n=1 Tax=Lottiidibacillus patelloidae TaxID=2670334 RepID=A0A263BY68_9BACI|nr:RluA family pseudouridine synthase [Lottiidibacillus patelloidae]OZM58522.1 RluA family pseudouridine synthase [Lottiidibacillus patelloidae]
MNKVQVTIEEKHENERLDKVLPQYDDWSRSQVQIWIKEGNLEVNGKTVKGNYKCKAGDEVTINIPEPEVLDVVPENIPLDIVFEDSDVVVVNKPRGMVVHPAPGHPSGTLVNGLMYHIKDLSGINGVLRPGIVHRIDKDTSGLLMVAKNDKSHESLVEQLKAKTTLRKYFAIVHGVIEHDHATIDAPIGRDKKDRQRMAVTNENSRDAVTHFNVVERFKDFSFIECQLETGRTHQIRVHMHYIGHPVAGDPKYGPKKTLDIEGQALHAATLGFEHPTTGEFMQFEAPLPDEMTKLLDELKKRS